MCVFYRSGHRGTEHHRPRKKRNEYRKCTAPLVQRRGGKSLQRFIFKMLLNINRRIISLKSDQRYFYSAHVRVSDYFCLQLCRWAHVKIYGQLLVGGPTTASWKILKYCPTRMSARPCEAEKCRQSRSGGRSCSYTKKKTFKILLRDARCRASSPTKKKSK